MPNIHIFINHIHGLLYYYIDYKQKLKSKETEIKMKNSFKIFIIFINGRKDFLPAPQHSTLETTALKDRNKSQISGSRGTV